MEKKKSNDSENNQAKNVIKKVEKKNQDKIEID